MRTHHPTNGAVAQCRSREQKVNGAAIVELGRLTAASSAPSDRAEAILRETDRLQREAARFTWGERLVTWALWGFVTAEAVALLVLVWYVLVAW